AESPHDCERRIAGDHESNRSLLLPETVRARRTQHMIVGTASRPNDRPPRARARPSSSFSILESLPSTEFEDEGRGRARGGRISLSLAFSLVEVMVAVGLLAVIIVGLLAMFYQTQRAFRAGMTQVDVLEAGRATMEMIARDFQQASYSTEVVVTNLEIMPAAQYSPVPMELPGGASVNLMIQDVSFVRRFNDE